MYLVLYPTAITHRAPMPAMDTPFVVHFGFGGAAAAARTLDSSVAVTVVSGMIISTPASLASGVLKSLAKVMMIGCDN